MKRSAWTQDDMTTPTFPRLFVLSRLGSGANGTLGVLAIRPNQYTTGSVRRNAQAFLPLSSVYLVLVLSLAALRKGEIRQAWMLWGQSRAFRVPQSIQVPYCVRK